MGGGVKVGYGVGGGGIWDDGVNGQRNTRGEARGVVVSEKHGAHSWYESQ